MRVSVIIPLFNKAPYIERAIRSVAAQTFTDFEIIVVDDGSTDGGLAVVESFADPRLRIIMQENAGPGAARNRGLKQAQGEFVAFLDADDEWLPDYLAACVRLLDAHGPNAAAVASGYIEHPAGVSREPMWRGRGLAHGQLRVTPTIDARLAIDLLAYMTSSTTVAKSVAVRNYGGFYERDHCTYAEDAHLWLKVLLNESVVINLTPLARIHFEASVCVDRRQRLPAVEPLLVHPEEIERHCPSDLRNLLSEILAIRALKTACVLGYWGRWREARELVRRFQVAGRWKLPYYTSSLVCQTPLGAALGSLSRTISSARLNYSQTKPASVR